MNLFGMNHNIFSTVEPTKDMAIECLNRYETNVAKGKIYADWIDEEMNKIYDRWGIKKGTVG